MSAVTASLCSTLMFVLFVSADQKIITAESGQDVTLTCRATNNNIAAVKWNRTDLVDKHVLLYQDGKFVPANQHPSFKNRVDLQDRQMKDGNVSLILKNVTINDTGRYECRVQTNETHSWDLITNLTVVVPPGPTGGRTKEGGKTDKIKEGGGKEDEHVGVAVSAAFLCAALLLVVGVVRFWIKRRLQSKTYDDPEITQPLTSSQEDSYTDDLKIS